MFLKTFRENIGWHVIGGEAWQMCTFSEHTVTSQLEEKINIWTPER